MQHWSMNVIQEKVLGTNWHQLVYTAYPTVPTAKTNKVVDCDMIYRFVAGPLDGLEYRGYLILDAADPWDCMYGDRGYRYNVTSMYQEGNVYIMYYTFVLFIASRRKR